MKPLKLIGSAIFILLFLFLITKFYLPHFLSYQKPVDSKNFLIEAWISSWEMEQAVKDFGQDPESRFYIIGYLYPKFEPRRAKSNRVNLQEETKNNNGIWLYTNSSLGFSLPSDLKFHTGDSIKIVVTTRGQKASSRFPYYNVVINGECIGGTFTQTDYTEYSFNWIVQKEGLNTLYIKFNNDLKANNSDRNLNVKSVQVGSHLLMANSNKSIIVRDLNNLTSGFGSQAEEIQNYLIQLGVDQEHISIINFERAQRNQTLAAALKFNEYLATDSLHAINVISTDIHSRRTWITYQRIIGKETDVGILFYPSRDQKRVNGITNAEEMYHISEEFLSYLANWFLLTF